MTHVQYIQPIIDVAGSSLSSNFQYLCLFGSAADTVRRNVHAGRIRQRLGDNPKTRFP